jgi:UDP-N-acetylmuramate--alanine ligase
MIDLKKAHAVHFIGIGGIGISAIARMMLLEGKSVTGTDRSDSKVTDELRKAGAKIFIGHDVKHVPDLCDLVIYTVAVPQDNPELVLAKERGIPLMTYPETLDSISKEKYTIAVSGTHGKTTTTAMIAKILIDVGLDPTVIVGSLMKRPDGGESNFIAGKSKYLVVEADEYKKSFHNLHPKILVINNLDLDHLDFYKDLADIQDSFRVVAERVPRDEYIVTDMKNKNIMPVYEGLEAQVIDYTDNIDENLKLLIPGHHNKSNAAAAETVGLLLGVDKEKIKKSLETFQGTWRRFEYKGQTKNGALMYDDYAHNPQKIKAALQGAREAFPDKKIVAVFQPHLFSRTKTLFDQFVDSFDDANSVLLTEIYPAREPFDPTISSKMLAEAIKKHRGQADAYATFEEIIEKLKNNYDTAEHVIITLGAGDGYKIGEALL